MRDLVRDVDIRDALRERSGGWCEAGLVGCAGRACHKHHRISQKMGGRQGLARTAHNRLSNLLYLCHACHGWATSRADQEAYEMGLCLWERQDPSAEPVVYRGRLMLLDDLGGLVEYDAAGGM